MALFDYKIAAGNNAAGSLVNIETIVPSGDKAFYPPVAYSSYSPGIFKVRADGKLFVAGYGSAYWEWAVLTRAQYEYLQDTYCGGAGSWSGLVTVRTRIGRRSYSNFNAVAALSTPAETNREYLVWRNARLTFTRLVAI